MTTIYDPTDPLYRDEADVRDELTRVFDICHGCRRCVGLCTAFPTLFEMIDRIDDRDAGLLTPAQQDRVVSECYQCKLCYLNCPYIPDLHDWQLDFPRLMLRAEAMRRANGHVTGKEKATDRTLGRTDRVGRAGVAAAPLANKVVESRPGSFVRKAVSAVTGVSAVRLLPPFARQRFSTWFAARPRVKLGQRQGAVTIFPTCLVEYLQPQVGKDLVRVYERNGIECATTDAGCCGAPSLHAGDVDRFAALAKKNVATLARAVRSGTDIVVPQPTCGYVLKNDYREHAAGPDADLVAEHTYDASEYLMKVHKADDTLLDTYFDGEVPAEVTYHTPCHLRAQNTGFESRDLIKLTGARVKLVQQCSGIGGMWGLRRGNEEIAVPIAERLGDMVQRAGGDVVAGDCHLANTAITEQTGARVVHPLQILARAYGIPAADE